MYECHNACCQNGAGVSWDKGSDVYVKRARHVTLFYYLLFPVILLDNSIINCVCTTMFYLLCILCTVYTLCFVGYGRLISRRLRPISHDIHGETDLNRSIDQSINQSKIKHIRYPLLLIYRLINKSSVQC